MTATDEGAVERDFELQLRPKEHLHESAVQRGTNWIARAVAAITQSAMQSLAAPHRIDSSSPHAYDVPTLKSLSLAYPANTSQAQRRHLNDSAQQALDSLGLTGVKLHLHAEPTAAVAELVGHALDSNGGDPISKKLAQGGAPAVCRIAVADFGAGTLDVALVVVEVHRQPGTNPSIALVTSFAAATPAAGDRLTALFSTVGAAQTGPRAAHQWFACEEPGKEGWMESLRKEGQSGNEKFHNVVAADRVDSGQSGLAIGLELIRGVARSYSPDVLVLGGRTGQSPIVQAVVRRALGDLARAVPIVAASEIVSNGDAASIDCGKSLVASGLGRAVAAHGGVHMTIHPAGNGAPWLAVAFPDPGSPTGFSRSAVDGHTLHEGLDPFPERGLEGNLSLNTAIAYIAYGFSGSRAGIPLWELRGPGGAAAWRAVVKGTGVFDLAVETEGGEVSCFAPAPADFHLYCQGRVSTSAACREHLLAARSQEPDNGRAT